MSFGSPTKTEKFYTGAKNDTVWNKDLLWQKHVTKEIKQSKINTGELPPDPSLKMRHPRMKMGITGTLIPDVTPRYQEPSTSSVTESPHILHSSSSRRRLVGSDHPDTGAGAAVSGPGYGCSDHYDTKSVMSRARSLRSSSSSSRHSHKSVLSSASSSILSSSSSHQSLRLEDVQEILDNQSRQLKEKTEHEMQAMRTALQSEARKREAAEMKLTMLCEKLGLNEK